MKKIPCSECGKLVTPKHSLRPYTCPPCAEILNNEANQEMGFGEYDGDDWGNK